MDNETLLMIGVIAAMLLVSGMFSAAETSLTTASEPLMHQLERKGDHRASRVRRLLVHKERLVGAILVGNNLVNILASALATSVMISFFGEAGVAYAAAVMTILVVTFGEVLPKTYAIRNADVIALAVAPVMRVIVAVLSPVTHTILIVVRGALRLFGIDTATESEFAHREELRGTIDLLGDTSPVVRQERAMLRSILDLGDVTVSAVMHHRKDIFMIDADLPTAEIVEQVVASPYTRIPLYRGDPENVVGILHAKAMLRLVRANNETLDRLDIESIAQRPWFIPESTSLLHQLQAFRQRREHFALVVDEYGALMGVVTLEDILEEIVGDIAESHEVVPVGVRSQKDGSYLVDGSVTIRDLNRLFDWNLPDERAATIAGLVINEARLIPEIGQTFIFHRFRFEILRRQRHQITAIRITPPAGTTASKPPPSGDLRHVAP